MMRIASVGLRIRDRGDAAKTGKGWVAIPSVN
jgi:hypothetical protein